MRGDEHEKAKHHVPPNAVPITKLEAASRQLRAAILLYFSNGDEVAIHTLAYASHEILTQLAKPKGIRAGLDGESVQMLGKGITAREARAFLGLSAGFFKHAGRDANATHMFQPEVNEHFLNEAVCLHVELTGEYHEEFECLRFAAMIRNPDLVNRDVMPPEEYEVWVRRAEDIKQRKISPRDLLPHVQKLAKKFIAAKKDAKSSL
jgi:hypothetical protein